MQQHTFTKWTLSRLFWLIPNNHANFYLDQCDFNHIVIVKFDHPDTHLYQVYQDDIFIFSTIYDPFELDYLPFYLNIFVLIHQENTNIDNDHFYL